MAHGDAAHADTAPGLDPARRPARSSDDTRVLVVGLSADEGRASARDYFAAFRWEPPAIDPAWLTASAFLALLDDLARSGSPTA